MLGASGGVGGVRGELGAGMECRYSGQKEYRWHWGSPRGYRGVARSLGGIRGHQGVSHGCQMCIGWLAGSVGTQVPEGV